MANALDQATREKARDLFVACGNIKQVSRDLKIGRNTVRRLIRSEGLLPDLLTRTLAVTSPTVEDLDFRMLEKLFQKAAEPGATGDFERQIKALALEIAREIGVKSRLDVTRFEVAVCEYVQYRRFLFCSMEASDKSYAGPFAKSHDKAAKAVLKWVEASQRAFDNFNRLCRELEVKYGKRGAALGRTPSVFVQTNQQFNVNK